MPHGQLSSDVARWLDHIRVLAVDIGPRGPTREGERKGAEYAQTQFKRMNLSPNWEAFQSARSIFLPHLIGSLLMLLAFAIYPLAGKTSAIIATGLSILVIVSEIQELGFYNNFYCLIIPKAESQNVYAIIPPAGEHRQDLVLVGHLDSQRTPFIFRTPTHVKIYDKLTGLFFVTFFLQALLYLISLFVDWPWIWYATIPTAIIALLLAAICFEADTTPFTAGANDNATAAGMVLTLAEQFQQAPLQNTRIFAVCTGCEEVQHYGMIDFYRRHRASLKNPKAVVFEMLGCGGPAWIVKEGIIVPFKADPQLVAICEEIATTRPELGAFQTSVSGGNSELSDAVRANVPAICLFGMTRDGVAPYWHQIHDTFDKMDGEVMQRTWQFTNALIEKIDQQA